VSVGPVGIDHDPGFPSDDDAYAPLGQPGRGRLGIVRYPNRAACFAMQPHRVIDGADHFIQEDALHELVEIIDGLVSRGSR
jgi:hypothetical protein